MYRACDLKVLHETKTKFFDVGLRASLNKTVCCRNYDDNNETQKYFSDVLYLKQFFVSSFIMERNFACVP